MLFQERTHLRPVFLVALIIALVILLPQAKAGFTENPTMDLKASSNSVGATDAVYTIHLEDPDTTEDMASLSIAIPAGYSIDQRFITSKPGINAGSAHGVCASWAGENIIITTTTIGDLEISNSLVGPVAQLIITEATSTTQGSLQVLLAGSYAPLNHGCFADLTTVKGFFINPSKPGTYTWAPSTANPKSGPPVVMDPRPSYSQTVIITGPSVTTTTSMTTTTPELPGPEIVLIALVALTFVAAKGRRH